jgi:hypothetical protein
VVVEGVVDDQLWRRTHPAEAEYITPYARRGRGYPQVAFGALEPGRFRLPVTRASAGALALLRAASCLRCFGFSPKRQRSGSTGRLLKEAFRDGTWLSRTARANEPLPEHSSLSCSSGCWPTALFFSPLQLRGRIPGAKCTKSSQRLSADGTRSSIGSMKFTSVHQPVAPLPRSCRACAAGTAGGCCQSLSRPGHAGSGRCVRRAPLRRPQRATHVPRCARASASPLSTARPPPAAPPARPAAACQPASRPACPPAHRPACLPACLGGGWPARRAAACLAPRVDHLADIRLASTSTARRRAARRGLS